MGLDMYLSASRYLSNYGFQNGEDLAKIEGVLDAVGLDTKAMSADSPGLQVKITVAYWRKVNAVHNWFVQNVQGGVDECQDSYVTSSQLRQLRDLCSEALASKDATLLPTTSGFFFGGTEIDEWYWTGIEYTRNVLTDILVNPAFDGFEFHYQASW